MFVTKRELNRKVEDVEGHFNLIIEKHERAIQDLRDDLREKNVSDVYRRTVDLLSEDWKAPFSVDDVTMAMRKGKVYVEGYHEEGTKRFAVFYNPYKYMVTDFRESPWQTTIIPKTNDVNGSNRPFIPEGGEAAQEKEGIYILETLRGKYYPSQVLHDLTKVETWAKFNLKKNLIVETLIG